MLYIKSIIIIIITVLSDCLHQASDERKMKMRQTHWPFKVSDV